MAVVTLPAAEVWVHLADDLATHLRFFYIEGPTSDYTPGQVRRYASGRLRTFTQDGEQRSIDVRLGPNSRADLDTLRSWAGRTLMLRDPAGRLVFGTFFDLDVSDSPLKSRAEASSALFVFEEITHSEAV